MNTLNRDMHAWLYRHVLHQRTYRTILLSSLNWGTCSTAYSRPMQEVRFSAHHSNRKTTACRSLLATFHTLWPFTLKVCVHCAHTALHRSSIKHCTAPIAFLYVHGMAPYGMHQQQHSTIPADTCKWYNV